MPLWRGLRQVSLAASLDRIVSLSVCVYVPCGRKHAQTAVSVYYTIPSWVLCCQQWYLHVQGGSEGRFSECLCVEIT